VELCVNKVLGDVPRRFHDRAEQGRALYPAHLHCRWDDDPGWLPFGLGQNISKIEAVRKMDNKPPKSITDVQLAEQDVDAGFCVMHELKQLGEDQSNLFDRL
jgi:hypothetical protein